MKNTSNRNAHRRTSGLVCDDGAVLDLSILLEQAAQPVSRHIVRQSAHEQLAVLDVVVSSRRRGALRSAARTTAAARLFRVAHRRQVAEQPASLLRGGEAKAEVNVCQFPTCESCDECELCCMPRTSKSFSGSCKLLNAPSIVWKVTNP